MTAEEFQIELKRTGYVDIETKTNLPNASTEPHSHPFAVRALVLAGEVTVTSEGASRTLRAGDTLEMAAGCMHSEHYGPEGSTSVVGRKHSV